MPSAGAEQASVFFEGHEQLGQLSSFSGFAGDSNHWFEVKALLAAIRYFSDSLAIHIDRAKSCCRSERN